MAVLHFNTDFFQQETKCFGDVVCYLNCEVAVVPACFDWTSTLYPYNGTFELRRSDL